MSTVLTIGTEHLEQHSPPELHVSAASDFTYLTSSRNSSVINWNKLFTLLCVVRLCGAYLYIIFQIIVCKIIVAHII